MQAVRGVYKATLGGGYQPQLADKEDKQRRVPCIPASTSTNGVLQIADKLHMSCKFTDKPTIWEEPPGALYGYSPASCH